MGDNIASGSRAVERGSSPKVSTLSLRDGCDEGGVPGVLGVLGVVGVEGVEAVDGVEEERGTELKRSDSVLRLAGDWLAEARTALTRSSSGLEPDRRSCELVFEVSDRCVPVDEVDGLIDRVELLLTGGVVAVCVGVGVSDDAMLIAGSSAGVWSFER